MNVGKEIKMRKEMLQLCRRLAGKELLTNGRSRLYKKQLKEVIVLQEEIDILMHCLSLKDFSSVGEALRQQAAANEVSL